MYKPDLALSNLQWLIYHKIKPNQIGTYTYILFLNRHILIKLATVVEGDQKAPFSIVTIPRCKGGCYSFPWIAPLYH